jgi:tetratricopeptide (TPR) repeat protein
MKMNPYVGLRPFERTEAHLFFGRKEDSERLIDRIIAAPLTLVYAQSGLGKTSLLRALVMPQLELEHYQAFYFDAWSGDDPTGALKTSLASQIMAPEDAEAWRERPLIELVRELTQATGRSLVLVLDQFEEFLINHSQQLDPLRQELAAVVRASGIDAHLVLVMREEFLAALEPFRQVILDIFQSTFRLESLTEDGVRAAIRCPAEAVGVEVEPALIERLVTDLRSTPQTAAQESTRPAIDLPMLQLVLNRLWTLTAVSGSPDLSIAAYERLGTASRILDGYVKSVMPSRRHDRLFTARLLQLLAPSSGYKASYSIDDLADLTTLDRQAIGAELERLSQHRIVRSRDFHGDRRYELLHDAFIPVVTPWRNKELRNAHRRRISFRSGLAAAAALLVFVAGVGGYIVYRNIQIYDHTHGRLLAALNSGEGDSSEAVKSAFEHATDFQLRYMLGWSTRVPDTVRAAFEYAASFRILDIPMRLSSRISAPFDPGFQIRYTPTFNFVADLDALRSFLVTWKKTINPSNWTYSEGLHLLRAPPEDWPYVLKYGARRDFDEWQFRLHWRDMAQALANKWGIPAPKRLRLVRSETLPENAMILTGPDGREASFDVPVIGIDAAIPDIPEQARSFADHFSSEWKKIEQVKWGDYLGVPLWSLPAWRTLGATVYHREAITAILVANEVLEQPRVFLSKPTVARLLDRAAHDYPSTVAEARAARGDRLATDLVALVESDNAITAKQLPRMLDLMAELPDKDSDEVARRVAEESEYIDTIFLTSFRGQPPASSDEDTETSPPDNDQEAVSSSVFAENYLDLPPIEPPIRVYFGSDIEQHFLASGNLKSQVIEKIENVRDRLYRASGITVPGVRFRDKYYSEAYVEPSQMRIEVLNQTIDNEDAKPFSAEPPKSLVDLFIDRLAFRAQALLPLWVDAEKADRIVYDELKINLDEWIRSRYSLTDLKVLFRKMIMPPLAATDALLASPEGTWVDLPPQNSIRHADWLLGSLVFWEQQIDLRDPDEVVNVLRETQKAAIHDQVESSGGATSAAEAEISDWINQGIASLDADALTVASKAFHAATQIDALAARKAFLAAYPKLLLGRADRVCEDLLDEDFSEPSDFSREVQLDIADAIETASSDHRRRLEICLLAATDRETRPQRWAQLVDRVLSEKDQVTRWQGDEAARFGQLLVEAYDPITADRDLAETARPLLSRALAQLGTNRALTVFNSVLDTCQKRGPRRWCWNLAHDLAKAHSHYGRIPLDFSWRIKESERREDLLNASSLLDAAESGIKSSSLDENNKDWLMRYVTYARVIIDYRLAILDADENLDPIIQKFRKIAKIALDEKHDIAQLAQQQLLVALRYAGRFDEARDELQEARKRWPDNIYLAGEQFWLAVRANDRKAAEEAADEFRRYIDEHGTDDPDYENVLYFGAMGEFLLPRDPWRRLPRLYLQTDHEYVNYGAVLLYALEDGPGRDEARGLLEARWRAVDESSWERRLALGDPDVWREMLLGYYLGRVPRDRLFGPLSDDTTFANSAFAQLPLPRLGMLCEAHFYEALLNRIQGSPAKMRAALEATISTGYRAYYEFAMAEFMLANQANFPPAPAAEQRAEHK